MKNIAGQLKDGKSFSRMSWEWQHYMKEDTFCYSVERQKVFLTRGQGIGLHPFPAFKRYKSAFFSAIWLLLTIGFALRLHLLMYALLGTDFYLGEF